MEEAAKGKGTVTSLSSLFPVEDAQKAAKRLQDSIAERQQMLDQLGGFVADNASLINLVRRLPDHLHHDIMVNPSPPNPNPSTIFSARIFILKENPKLNA